MPEGAAGFMSDLELFSKIRSQLTFATHHHRLSLFDLDCMKRNHIHKLVHKIFCYPKEIRMYVCIHILVFSCTCKLLLTSNCEHSQTPQIHVPCTSDVHAMPLGPNLNYICNNSHIRNLQVIYTYCWMK